MKTLMTVISGDRHGEQWPAEEVGPTSVISRREGPTFGDDPWQQKRPNYDWYKPVEAFSEKFLVPVEWSDETIFRECKQYLLQIGGRCQSCSHLKKDSPL